MAGHLGNLGENAESHAALVFNFAIDLVKIQSQNFLGMIAVEAIMINRDATTTHVQVYVVIYFKLSDEI